VATSTLELGIDVGDLDRVIQVNSPPTVTWFLQRMDRTGRRPNTPRNCLFLSLSEGALARTSGMLHLWSSGYIEPVTPPIEPRRIEQVASPQCDVGCMAIRASAVARCPLTSRGSG
jgi:ATP-dependent helicase Lhr and Lhr-like helicase